MRVMSHQVTIYQIKQSVLLLSKRLLP